MKITSLHAYLAFKKDMQNKFIWLTIIGTTLPNIFVLKESLATGNYLLYADPIATFQGMFANNISSAFTIDLLFVVMLFLYWSHQESQRLNIKNYWLVWIYTFAFGIAGGLPLFLYIRQKQLQNSKK